MKEKKKTKTKESKKEIIKKFLKPKFRDIIPDSWKKKPEGIF